MPSLQLKIELPCDLDYSGLHTIVSDTEGNIYLSDEFEHRLFSFDSTGALRWQIGEKGADRCRFFYPRGLDLGKITVGKENKCCLAVCDAWNNRIQFFDFEGVYLCSWQKAGEREFREVCDILYIGDPNLNAPGYWYVLDRNNHRLCVLDSGGQLVFELGKCFPPGLEPRYFHMELDPARAPVAHGIEHNSFYYEPLYYPAKILGRSVTDLYLFEPFSNRIKQPLCGSLLPLNIRLMNDCAWISAQDGIFLAHDRKNRCLRWMDGTGNILQEYPVEGTAVGSNAGPEEVWLHSGNRLELWHFEWSTRDMKARENREPFAALIETAKEEMKSGNPANTFSVLVAGLVKCFGICRQATNLVDTGCRDMERCRSIQADALSCWRQTVESGRPSSDQIRNFRLLSLKLPVLSGACRRSELLSRLCAGFNDFMQKMMHAVSNAVRIRDEAVLIRHNLQLRSKETDAPMIDWLAELVRFQLSVIREMLFCFGTHTRRIEWQSLSSESPDAHGGDGFPINWNAPWNPPYGTRSSRCLHEHARFRVLPPDIEELPNPHCVVQTSEGDFYITLFSRGTVARLDADGNFVEELFKTESSRGTPAHPTGLALDRQERLWIVEQRSKRVRIHDLRKSGSFGKAFFPETSNLLISPVGIGEGPDGRMLVADVGSQRLISFREGSPAEIFCDRIGTAPGEFRCPTGICTCSAVADPGVWVVDQRNHRLQKLDRHAKFAQQIGKCGMDRGSLLAPWFAAQFSDGVLAVSQGEIEPCLKLFSPEGEELDCMFLDYWPAGLFIRNEKLIVPEWDGRFIRIYERS